MLFSLVLVRYNVFNDITSNKSNYAVEILGRNCSLVVCLGVYLKVRIFGQHGHAQSYYLISVDDTYPLHVRVDALEKYFEQFGDILEVVVIRDRNTSKPRGFGFVTFKDEDALAAVMAHEGHTIDGKEISVKRSHQKESQSISAKKLFVGGMPNTVTQEDMHGYFSMYGPVEETQVMYDHMTGRSRGFGFVMFENENNAHACLYGGPHRLKGELVDVKPATPKTMSSNKPRSPYYYQNQMQYQQYVPGYMPNYSHMYAGGANGGYMSGTGGNPQLNPLMMMHPGMMGQSSLSPPMQQQTWMPQHRAPIVYSNFEESQREHYKKHHVKGREQNGRDQLSGVSPDSVDDFSNNNNTSTQAHQ